ncbi:MAG: hypothetical protein LBL98_08455 [Ruminococcus sp.]|jgi:hypothetical protein|nr:hypothetical protein [Ruminococcus sp.]
MKLTGELLTKARTAKSPEELITIADKMGVTVSANDAALYYNRLHTEPELTEDELDAITVSGGGCGGGSSSGVSVNIEPGPPKCIHGKDNMKVEYSFCYMNKNCPHYISWSEPVSHIPGAIRGFARCDRDPDQEDW